MDTASENRISGCETSEHKQDQQVRQVSVSVEHKHRTQEQCIETPNAQARGWAGDFSVMFKVSSGSWDFDREGDNCERCQAGTV